MILNHSQELLFLPWFTFTSMFSFHYLPLTSLSTFYFQSLLSLSLSLSFALYCSLGLRLYIPLELFVLHYSLCIIHHLVCSLWYFVYSSWIVRLAFFIMHNSSLGFGTLYIRLLTSLSLCFSSSWSALSFSASSAWMITSHVYSTRPHYHHHPILPLPFHHGEYHLVSGWLWLFQPACRAGRKWKIWENLRKFERK